MSKIYPHEETIFENIVKLAIKIQSQQKFTWPILAETESGAILDGMHRWQVLTCHKYIPIQEIAKYSKNRGIRVGVWCRVIKEMKKNDIGLINTILKRCGMSTLQKIGKLPKDPTEIELEIRARKNMILISPDREYYQFKTAGNLVQEFKDMVKLEQFFGNNILGRTKFYETERNTLKLIGKPNNILIFPRPMTKHDVIRITLRTKKGIEESKPLTEVLPPKSSRHVFQLRIFNINIPLRDLNSDKSSTQLTNELHKRLQSQRILYLGKDVDWEDRPHYKGLDRHYEEHMFKFY